MNIFSGVEKHPERIFDQRLSLSVRLPVLLHLLLGRTPVRRLAQSLIAVLLLISPLSFSTDKVSKLLPTNVRCHAAVRKKPSSPLPSSGLRLAEYFCTLSSR